MAGLIFIVQDSSVNIWIQLAAVYSCWLLCASDGASETELADLLREMEIMKSIGRHINIINFLGCCTQNDGKFVLQIIIDAEFNFQQN